jgi:hypothetical protein
MLSTSGLAWEVQQQTPLLDFENVSAPVGGRFSSNGRTTNHNRLKASDVQPCLIASSSI